MTASKGRLYFCLTFFVEFYDKKQKIGVFCFLSKEAREQFELEVCRGVNNRNNYLQMDEAFYPCSEFFNKRTCKRQPTIRTKKAMKAAISKIVDDAQTAVMDICFSQEEVEK